jgi:replicative DNA helicase
MKINELLEYLNKYGNIDEYDCYTFEKPLTLKFNDKIYKDVTSIAIEKNKMNKDKIIKELIDTFKNQTNMTVYDPITTAYEEDEDIDLKLLAKLLKNCKSTFQIEEFNQCINLYIKINSNFDSLHYFFIYKNGKVLNKLIKLIGEFKNV